MSADPRMQADAELLEALAQGRLAEGDPRLEQLFARQPRWRELLEHARAGTRWSDAASEADRRLVAECLAEARAPARPRAAALEPGERPRAARRRLLLALAATILAAGALLLWWPRERDRTPSPGEMLGSSVDSFEWGKAAPDFGTFEWKLRKPAPGRQSYVLRIWAAGADGTRGLPLYHHETREERWIIEPAERADWPDSLIWRVDWLDSSGGTSLSPEWRAQRGPR